MIKLKEQGDLLQVTVSGVFDFDTAREMLLKSKAQLKQDGLSKIDIHMEQVSSCNSCAVGAMLLLSEQVPSGFRVHLSNCDKGVHQLFDSGIFDSYFYIDHSHDKQADNPCARCFNSGCQTPVPGCGIVKVG